MRSIFKCRGCPVWVALSPWRHHGRDGGGRDNGKTRIEGGQVGHCVFVCALYFFSTLCVPTTYTHWIRSSRCTEHVTANLYRKWYAISRQGLRRCPVCSESNSPKRIEVGGGINAYAAYEMQAKHSQVVQFDIAVNCQVFHIEVLCCCQLAARARGGVLGSENCPTSGLVFQCPYGHA